MVVLHLVHAHLLHLVPLSPPHTLGSVTPCTVPAGFLPPVLAEAWNLPHPFPGSLLFVFRTTKVLILQEAFPATTPAQAVAL